MQDDATRFVGLDGLVVTEVQRNGEQLDLQVELLARAPSPAPTAAAPRCASRSARLCGCATWRPTRLTWCERRYRCSECFAHAHRDAQQLPARQRATIRCSGRGWLSACRAAPRRSNGCAASLPAPGAAG